MKRWWILIAGILCGLIATAQDMEANFTKQQLMWYRGYADIQFGDHWKVHAEAEFRRYMKPHRQHHWIIPLVKAGYRTKSGVEPGVGFMYFRIAFPQDADTEVDVVRPEYRPVQYVTIPHKFPNVSLSHRIQLEQRYRPSVEGLSSMFLMRVRYLFKLSIPLTRTGKRFPLSLVLLDEAMLQFGDTGTNTFDQNRIYGGFKLELSPNWAVSLGYLNWVQQQSAGKNFFLRHIVRFGVGYTLRVQKKGE